MKSRLQHLSLAVPANALIRHLPTPTEEYPLKNERTTYYVCQGRRGMPPTNDLHEILNVDKY